MCGLRYLEHLPQEDQQVQQDGAFISRWVPGPANYAQWLGSYRVMRSALMLDVIFLTRLLRWESFMEKLHNRYTLLVAT